MLNTTLALTFFEHKQINNIACNTKQVYNGIYKSYKISCIATLGPFINYDIRNCRGGGAKSGDSDKTTVGRDENCMNWFDIALL